jgi:hypothetical protein
LASVSINLLAASSFFRSSNSSRETSFGKELLLVHAEVGADSEVSLLVVDVDLRISTGFSTVDPFGRLVPVIEGIFVESVVASDMTTSFADPVDEAESVEDTDSIDDLRLAESSLLPLKELSSQFSTSETFRESKQFVSCTLISQVSFPILCLI